MAAWKVRKNTFKYDKQVAACFAAWLTGAHCGPEDADSFEVNLCKVTVSLTNQIRVLGGETDGKAASKYETCDM